MDKLIRYLPDETGKNQDNLIRNERHHLPVQVRGRIIVPNEGSFFGNSVRVRDKLTKRELTPKKDYTFGGLRVAHTRLIEPADDAIYALIIVTDDKCSTEVEIDYQVYANDDFQFVEPTIALLEESFESNDGIPMAKLLKLPKGYKPTFHYHDLGNIDKFDFMLFCLEKIRNSILNNNPELFKFLLDFENMLYLLTDKANAHFEARLYEEMKKFAKSFDPSLFGLGNVKNYPLMATGDGAAIASRAMFTDVQESKEAYLNLGSLSEFTKELFKHYVDSDSTNLGRAREMVVTASTADFEALPIGAIFTINDYNFAEIAGNPEIEKFYPDRIDRTNGYVIRKITSKESKFGSLFVYVGRSNARVYVLRLFPGDNGSQSKFTYIANSLDQPGYLHEIDAHIEDRTNPHMDDKRDVDLAQVENIGVASMEEIICNIPARKMLTVENILHYMKRFKTGKKDTSDIFANLSERSIRKQMQTIYSPCGAWDDNLDIDKIELCKVIEVPTIEPPIDPTWSVTPDKLLLEFELEEVTTTTTTTTTTTQKPKGNPYIVGFKLGSNSNRYYHKTGNWNKNDFAETYEEQWAAADAFERFVGEGGVPIPSWKETLTIHAKMYNFPDKSKLRFQAYRYKLSDVEEPRIPFIDIDNWMTNRQEWNSGNPFSDNKYTISDDDILTIEVFAGHEVTGDCMLVVFSDDKPIYCIPLRYAPGMRILLGFNDERGDPFQDSFAQTKLPLTNWVV